jgi:prevent-host-death family protein
VGTTHNAPFFELDYPQKSLQCFAIKKPASNPTQKRRSSSAGATDLTRKTGHIILVISEKRAVMQKIAAAQFKAQCLAVMDQVSKSGRPVVITKHGKPVVKLVPVNEGEDEIFGVLAGIARIAGDIENTVPASDWGVE